MAHFHGDEVSLVGIHAHQNLTILTSLSRDGEFLSRLLHAMGYFTVRGSSSKGGTEGLLSLVRVIRKEGKSVSLAVDGPRGPAYHVKSGVIALAKLTGVPVIPAAANSEHYFSLKKTWDKTQIPLPFSRVIMHYGEPIYVPRDASEEQMEHLRIELENSIKNLKTVHKEKEILV